MVDGVAGTEITLILFSGSIYHFWHDKELRIAALKGREVQDLKIITLSHFSSWWSWPFIQIHSDSSFKIYFQYCTKLGCTVLAQSKIRGLCIFTVYLKKKILRANKTLGFWLTAMWTKKLHISLYIYIYIYIYNVISKWWCEFQKIPLPITLALGFV